MKRTRTDAEDRLIEAALAFCGFRDCGHPDCGPMSPHGVASIHSPRLHTLYKEARRVSRERKARRSP